MPNSRQLHPSFDGSQISFTFSTSPRPIPQSHPRERHRVRRGTPRETVSRALVLITAVVPCLLIVIPYTGSHAAKCSTSELGRLVSKAPLRLLDAPSNVTIRAQAVALVRVRQQNTARAPLRPAVRARRLRSRARRVAGVMDSHASASPSKTATTTSMRGAPRSIHLR